MTILPSGRSDSTVNADAIADAHSALRPRWTGIHSASCAERVVRVNGSNLRLDFLRTDTRVRKSGALDFGG